MVLILCKDGDITNAGKITLTIINIVMYPPWLPRNWVMQIAKCISTKHKWSESSWRVCVSVWEERCRCVNVLAARGRRRRWGKHTHTHTHTHTQSVLWLRVCLSVRITMCICESCRVQAGDLFISSQQSWYLPP